MPKQDLLQVFTKPLLSMNDDELLNAVNDLREMRLVHHTKARKDSLLDGVLKRLDMDVSRQIVQVLREKEKEKKEEKEKEKGKENVTDKSWKP